jgi:hypothetical protein
VIKELFPKENTNPYQRFDQLDIEIFLGMYDLGDLDNQTVSYICSLLCDLTE